jgi:hypothetical protein
VSFNGPPVEKGDVGHPSHIYANLRLRRLALVLYFLVERTVGTYLKQKRKNIVSCLVVWSVSILI